MTANIKCSIDGCSDKHKARGMCALHYGRLLRLGDPLPLTPRRVKNGDVLARLMTHVADPNEAGCWLWTGHLNREGYGKFRVAGDSGMAHRHAYVLMVGPIPEGFEIDHLCKARNCVNPDHLEAVTKAENIRRATAVREARRGAA